MKEKTFEENMALFDQYMERLENEKLGLQETMDVYAKAKHILKAIEQELEDVSQKFATIVEEGKETPIQPLQDSQTE